MCQPKRKQTIIRKVETCAVCGALGRFRVHTTRIVNGKRIGYARCAKCGARAVVRYVE